MSKRHGMREQKRLAKQKAKRNARRRQLAVRNSPDPTVRLREAVHWPVVATLVAEGVWSTGLGTLLIARRASEGQLACAVFLVDVFCLGVKDALWKIVTPSEFRSLRADFDAHVRLREVTPEYFAKLVYDAAEYGRSLGFSPHPDFRHASRLLDGIDPSQCCDQFEFGRDGKPMYFRGPGESLEQAHRIAAQVESLGGTCTVMLKPSEALPEFEAFDDSMDDDGFDLEPIPEPSQEGDSPIFPRRLGKIGTVPDGSGIGS